MNNNIDTPKKFKNEFNYQFNNYLILTSIGLLNLFGFKYYLPTESMVPKNHLDKYIEYQLFLQKEKGKKQMKNYFNEINKSNLKKLPIYKNNVNNINNNINNNNINIKNFMNNTKNIEKIFVY